MIDSILLDNDVILKICAYRLENEMLACTTVQGKRPSILAVARYSIRTRIERSRNLIDPADTANTFESLLTRLRLVEPDQTEIALAAELEQKAVERALDLDTGESQLFAILLTRGGMLFVTGDKRALRALEQLTADLHPGKCLVCLEQLALLFIARYDFGSLRVRICREPRADRVLATCFSCASASASAASAAAGLRSYIEDIRRGCPTLLISSGDLLAVVS
jgi:hypothetical protein